MRRRVPIRRKPSARGVSGSTIDLDQIDLPSAKNTIYHDQPLDPKKERIPEQAGPLQLENVSEQASESETAVDVDEWLRKS